LLLFPRNPF